jgi:hypothetical protein
VPLLPATAVPLHPAAAVPLLAAAAAADLTPLVMLLVLLLLL